MSSSMTEIYECLLPLPCSRTPLKGFASGNPSPCSHGSVFTVKAVCWVVGSRDSPGPKAASLSSLSSLEHEEYEDVCSMTTKLHIQQFCLHCSMSCPFLQQLQNLVLKHLNSQHFHLYLVMSPLKMAAVWRKKPSNLRVLSKRCR